MRLDRRPSLCDLRGDEFDLLWSMWEPALRAGWIPTVEEVVGAVAVIRFWRRA